MEGLIKDIENLFSSPNSVNEQCDLIMHYLISHIETIWLDSDLRTMCSPGFEDEQAAVDKLFEVVRSDVNEGKFNNKEEGMTNLVIHLNLISKEIRTLARTM